MIFGKAYTESRKNLCGFLVQERNNHNFYNNYNL